MPQFPMRQGLSYDENLYLYELYLMSDAVFGSSDVILEIPAHKILKLCKRLQRDHPVDWVRTEQQKPKRERRL